MKLRAIGALALCLALLGAACGDDKDSGGTTTTTAAGKTVKLGAADDGTTVEVAEGDQIEATVESSAGIPYTWKVLDVDDAVLVQMPGSGEVPTSAATIPGGQQAFTFVFDVVGAGTSPLEIGLVSITNPEDVAQRLSVTVDAR